MKAVGVVKILYRAHSLSIWSLGDPSFQGLRRTWSWDLFMKELLFPLGSLDELRVQLYTLETETMQKELGKNKTREYGRI